MCVFVSGNGTAQHHAHTHTHKLVVIIYGTSCCGGPQRPHHQYHTNDGINRRNHMHTHNHTHITTSSSPHNFVRRLSRRSYAVTNFTQLTIFFSSSLVLSQPQKKTQIQRNDEHTTLTVDSSVQMRTSRGKEFHFGKFATNSDVFVGGMPNW